MIRREHKPYPLLEGDAETVGADSFYLDEITLLNSVKTDEVVGVAIGHDVRFGARCWLNGFGGIWIGNDVLVGPGCFIHSANHRVVDGVVQPMEWDGDHVIIGHNVWIGANVVVLPGACIEDDTIVGAGSVVAGYVKGTVHGPKAT